MPSTNKYAISPTSVDAIAARARAAIEQQRWSDAIEAMERVVSARRSLAAISVEERGQLSRDLSDLAHVWLSARDARQAELAAREAIAVDPHNALAQCNLGAALRGQAKFPDAAGCYEAAFAMDENLLTALFLQGLSTLEAGDVDTAIETWRKAIDRFGSPLPFLRGVVLAMAQRGLANKSAEFARAAVAQNPSDEPTLTLLSSALSECGDAKEAERLAVLAITRCEGRSPLAHFAMGLARHAQGNFSEAVSSYENAIALAPQLARAYANLGDVLFAVGEAERGTTSFERAIELAPEDAYTFTKYAAALARGNRTDRALEIAERAIRLAPRSPEALMNLGTIELDLDRIDDAIRHFREGIQIDPTSVDLHYSLAMALLTDGQLANGWTEFAFRTEVQAPPHMREWDGSDLQGEPIVLVAEQGFGDTIQFARFISWVHEVRHGKASLVCAPALVELMKTIPALENSVFTSLNDPATKQTKTYASLLRLPHHARVETLDAIANQAPYLSARPLLDELIRSRLAAAGDKPRIGIAWAGNPEQSNDRRRSMSFAEIQMLFDPRASIYSLQVGAAASADREAIARAGVMALGDRLVHFATTASVMNELDLIITVDTSIAHLAGALGRTVWILLAKNADWRWLRTGESSYWYPSARLFRQRKLDDWSPVIDEVRSALRKFIDSNPQSRTDRIETAV